MCHENEMGAAKEQHPYIICRLDKQRRWNSGGTVTRPLFIILRFIIHLSLFISVLAVFRFHSTPRGGTDICRATSPAHSSEAVTNHTSG